MDPREKIKAFRRILLLEEKRGFDDRAVVGGLDRFLSQWREEAEASGDRDLLRRLKALGLPEVSYGRMSPSQRARWVEQVLRQVEKWLAPAPRGPAPPAPRPVSSRPRRSIPHAPSLDSPVTVVRGVGPALAGKLRGLGLHTVRDLLYHLPRRHIPLRPIADLVVGEEQGVVGIVWEVRTLLLGERQVECTEAVVGDETGNLRVVWFNQPFVARTLRTNDRVMVTGYPRLFRGLLTLEATGYEVLDGADPLFTPGRLFPLYPSTEGLAQRALRRAVREALDAWLPRLEDPLPEGVRERHALLSLQDALLSAHYPATELEKEEARRRLAFDELLTVQVALLSLKRHWQEEGKGIPLPADPRVLEAFLSSLPFRLTEAQERALGEILQDIARPRPMSRLLQGEVGSGKTVVALAAMMVCATDGYQAALMAPTEVLAEQHFLTVSRLLQGLARPVQEEYLLSVYLDPHPRPLVVGLLLGSMPRSQKEEVQARLARGEIDIVVGTHALIQEEVSIPRLALAVVDEQHRFGVRQRRELREKGERPHLLAMSATPIPRSLALTLYGDLDLSVIDQLPGGRQPVKTYWLRPGERDRVYQFIRSQVARGRQAFVLCPLIQESETLQTRAALEEHRRLSQEVFPDLRVGLLHGRMPLREKVEVMERFRRGEMDILVATPVVEVGIDVPNATVMLVEGAERFGLSELHQLRGRVGRGEHPGYCFLIPSISEGPSPEEGERFAAVRERLEVLVREGNGFRVAEEDLRLRGPGEVFGVRQSGLPDLKVARLSDLDLLSLAREEAGRILERDLDLSAPEHRALRERVRPLLERLAPQAELS